MQVRVYTPKRLFYQLEAAKEEFIRAMAGVWKEQKLLLPKLMEAYAKDVRLSPQGLVDMVQRHPTSFYSLTDWEGGYFPLTLHFSEDYPSKPPKCKFPHGFFHPNVYPSGTVYLSILNEGSGWRPAITVKQILVGIQDLLDQPIPADPSQTDGYHLFILDPTEYKRRLRLQAKQYPALV